MKPTITKEISTKTAPKVIRKSTGHLILKTYVHGARYTLQPGLPPIREGQWLPEEQRVKRAAKIAHKGRVFSGEQLNATLERYSEAITEYVKRTGRFDKDAILSTLALKPGGPGFYDQVFALIDTLKEVKPQTRSAKRTIWKKIQRYFPTLGWDTINLTFYDRLLQALADEGIYQPGKYIKEVKAMCRLGLDRDYPVCLDFQKKSFRVVWSETQEDYQDYLTLEEINTLYDLNNPIVNGFLVGCYTGLRHSDWHKVDPNKAVASIAQQKTKSIVEVPIHPRVRQLFARGVKFISNQKTNDAIRDLVPGKKITTHSARRTFATLQYQSGTPLSILHRLTGHASEKQLRTYLKLGHTDIAKMALDYNFYKL